jgi:hypothetical protein
VLVFHANITQRLTDLRKAVRFVHLGNLALMELSLIALRIIPL